MENGDIRVNIKKFEVLFCFEKEFLADVADTFSKDEKRIEVLSGREICLARGLNSIKYHVMTQGNDIEYWYTMERFKKDELLPIDSDEIIIKYTGYLLRNGRAYDSVHGLVLGRSDDDVIDLIKSEIDEVIKSITIFPRPITPVSISPNLPDEVTELKVDPNIHLKVFKYMILEEDKKIHNIFGDV